MKAVAWCSLRWCQWSLDSERQNEEKKAREWRVSSSSSLSQVSMTPPAEHRENGEMKAEATALNESNQRSERSPTGGKQHRSTKTEQPNRLLEIWDAESSRHQHFPDESPQNANLVLLYFSGFVEFQDMKCNQVEMLSASKQIKLHYSWQCYSSVRFYFCTSLVLKLNRFTQKYHLLILKTFSFEDKQNY